MRKRFLISVILLAAIIPIVGFTPKPTSAQGDLSTIRLPEGFTIDIFADIIRGARSLTLSENGTLFVGTRNVGSVYAIPNAATSTRAERVFTIASGLNAPNGVAMRDGSLYVAEVSRILRYDNIEDNLAAPPQPVVVIDTLPREGHHGWKFMAFGPDDKLYFNVGAPCNVCEVEGLFATISRINPDGTGLEVYAEGVRNSVGFDWHPVTNEMWITNNGRDWMGNDSPPDTIHYAPEPGLHFGFPYCHGGTIPDPDFGDRRSCDEFDPPARNVTPHGAVLGARFYTGDMFPDVYTHQLFVAEHGSWNRQPPIGYRVMLATLDETGTRVTDYVPFAEGWLPTNGQAWGRPVDVEVMPDGALLVSDDAANVIYRISYSS